MIFPASNKCYSVKSFTIFISSHTQIHMSHRLKFLLAGTVILITMEWRTLLYYVSPPPDFSHGKVVLYATDWCPYCEKTRTLLEQRHIPYKEYNIESSEEGRHQYKQLAGKGVPVLLVAGEVVRGYHEKRMATVLDQWQATQHNKTVKEK